MCVCVLFRLVAVHRGRGLDGWFRTMRRARGTLWAYNYAQPESRRCVVVAFAAARI